MAADNLYIQIAEVLSGKSSMSSLEIFEELPKGASYATVKRRLQSMVLSGNIEVSGKGRGTRYSLHEAFPLTYEINSEDYFEKEVDARNARVSFNHDLIPLLSRVQVFTPEEDARLGVLHERHTRRLATMNDDEYRREMERLAIDLSWKSSQIEGNTYSLLETERLIKQKVTAEGKTLDEASMLLNHKSAIDFILTEPGYVNPLGVRAIEDIHSILVKDLGVSRNIRQRSVGISGTRYRPLDNEFQIREAMEDTCRLINHQQNPFAKALLLLLMISYIQPFNDGNKRTARIVANAMLLAKNHCPLSFRTVDPLEYKKAILIFYEQNNLSVFKKLFIDQVEFAVENYFL